MGQSSSYLLIIIFIVIDQLTAKKNVILIVYTGNNPISLYVCCQKPIIFLFPSKVAHPNLALCSQERNISRFCATNLAII